MANYTKGQWTIRHYHDCYNKLTSIEIGTQHIAPIYPAVCTISNSSLTESAEANARLIAAAPEMYEALRSLIQDYEHCAKDESGKIDRWRKNLITKARQALNKAEDKNDNTH